MIEEERRQGYKEPLLYMTQEKKPPQVHRDDEDSSDGSDTDENAAAEMQSEQEDLALGDAGNKEALGRIIRDE